MLLHPLDKSRGVDGPCQVPSDVDVEELTIANSRYCSPADVDVEELTTANSHYCSPSDMDRGMFPSLL